LESGVNSRPVTEVGYTIRPVDFRLSPEQEQIRRAVREIVQGFPAEYWRKLDRDLGYPTEFVDALTEGGWLAALIPEEYEGSGLGVLEASLILEEVNHSPGNSAVCHAQMYVMGTLLRHGSEEQKRRLLPAIARGEIRLQAFGVTEPGAGSDTTKLQTFARKAKDRYVVSGKKAFISRTEHSDFMLLLARTTPAEEVAKKTEGLSVFLVDLRQAIGKGVTVRPIRTMMNHHSCELFFDGLEVPAGNLVGEEGQGFRYILDGMNAERILIAAECIGDARFFLDRATEYAKERVVFGRPIGQNQGIQFPLALAHAHTEAADLVRFRAADAFDRGRPSGADANLAKLLAADASWEAGNAALQTFGGFGFAAEYDIERKLRETRLYQVAPVSTNLILTFISERVLGLPRSY
jgi:acyl-CoA dehydrogenase